MKATLASLASHGLILGLLLLAPQVRAPHPASGVEVSLVTVAGPPKSLEHPAPAPLSGGGPRRGGGQKPAPLREGIPAPANLSVGGAADGNLYLTQLAQRLAERRVYPSRSRQLREEGRVEVLFRILQNGAIDSPRLGRSSRFERLDQAALELVASAGPLPPPPPGLTRTWPLEVRLPVDYRLR